MASISLVSLNIERSKHLDLVASFLKERQADIVCIQELMEHDIPLLEAATGGRCNFIPFAKYSYDARGIIGVGIFSRLPVSDFSARYYLGEKGVLKEFDRTDTSAHHATTSRALVVCDAEVDGGGEVFRIATTHFTWTPDGHPDDFQRQDMRAMLGILEDLGEFVLCGDLNAPRMVDGKPGEIYEMLASKYKDNIPPEYETSIDVDRHRNAGDRPHELADKMVDHLFTTPGYIAEGVELVKGVSDHFAIVAKITTAG